MKKYIKDHTELIETGMRSSFAASMAPKLKPNLKEAQEMQKKLQALLDLAEKGKGNSLK